jgi:hypothetical protein
MSACHPRATAGPAKKKLFDLGALKSLTFVRVEPSRGDECDAEFANGTMGIVMRLNDDGRIDGAGWQPK